MIVDPNDYYHKIYFESNSEFEEVRRECLKEDNWLRTNYLPENLKIEEHSGYAVIFQKGTDALVGMAGVYHDATDPANVARHCHREYLFPAFRRRSFTGLVSGWHVYHEHVLKPLYEVNNFDLYVITMQNRSKKESKGYWDVWSSSLITARPEWTLGQDYIQTKPYNVQKCWQNFVYNEVTPGSYAAWNPTLTTHADWLLLEEGA